VASRPPGGLDLINAFLIIVGTTANGVLISSFQGLLITKEGGDFTAQVNLSNLNDTGYPEYYRWELGQRRKVFCFWSASVDM